MKVFFVTIATACICFGQAAIRPGSANTAGSLPATGLTNKTLTADVPLLGYFSEPNSTQIYSIHGTAARPRVGAALQVPEGVTRVNLPPRQSYSLLEREGAESVSVWDFHREPVPVSGAMAHPDLTVFSPRGDAAVLFSNEDGSLQVLGHLPNHPEVMHSIVAPSETISKMAVSDDGSVLITRMSNGSVMLSSSGEPWVNLPSSLWPEAWTFLPNRHDLLILDSAGRIVILPALGGSAIAEQIVATKIQADTLAVTTDGRELFAESTQRGSLVQIHLPSGEISPVKTTSTPVALSLLRGGRMLLTSATPSLSVISVPSSPDIADQP